MNSTKCRSKQWTNFKIFLRRQIDQNVIENGHIIPGTHVHTMQNVRFCVYTVYGDTIDSPVRCDSQSKASPSAKYNQQEISDCRISVVEVRAVSMAAAAPLANFQRKGRVNRILKKLEPQLVENTKRALIIKGTHTSQSIIDVLKDFSKLLKPNCKVLGRKNEITPFDDGNSLEFLTSKNDCSLFVVGSHSKKRTNNLIMVRSTALSIPLFNPTFIGGSCDKSHLYRNLIS